MQTDYQGVVDRLSRYRDVVHEAARAYAAVARTDKSLSPAARAIVVQTCDTFVRTNDLRHLERYVNGCAVMGSRSNWRDLNSIEGLYVIRRSTRWIGVSACRYSLLPLIPESLLEELRISSQQKTRRAAQKAEAGEPSQSADEGAPEPENMPAARKGRRGGRSKKAEAHAPA